MQEKESIICVRYGQTPVPRVTVWHHSAEPRDAKTVTLGTDLSVRTSHSCQILILWLLLNCIKVDSTKGKKNDIIGTKANLLTSGTALAFGTKNPPTEVHRLAGSIHLRVIILL